MKKQDSSNLNRIEDLLREFCLIFHYKVCLKEIVRCISMLDLKRYILLMVE